MSGIYAKLKKIKTPSYRVFSYLFNEKRQEVLIGQGGIQDKQFWKDLEEYERSHPKTQGGNNEALEIMLTLPNSLMGKTEELNQIVAEYIDKLGIKDHPYSYAIHQKAKNADTDNLHAHIVFSERKINKEVKQKTYKRDIWQDPITHKLTKNGVGELVHKKGDLIFKDNKPVYENEPYTIKDKRFKEQKFVFDKNRIAKDILNARGYQYEVRFKKDNVKLKQYHLSKGLKEKNPQKYNEMKELNKSIQNFNTNNSNLYKLNNEKARQNKKEVVELIKQKPQRQNLISFIKNKTTEIIQTIKNINLKAKEKIKETTREIAFKWNISKNSVKNFQDEIIVKDFQDGFSYNISLRKKDFEVLHHDDPQKYKIGIKKGSQIEIRDARSELSFNVRKGDENLLLKHLGVNLESLKKQQERKPLNLNEYKQKAKEINANRTYTPIKSKGWERE